MLLKVTEVKIEKINDKFTLEQNCQYLFMKRQCRLQNVIIEILYVNKTILRWYGKAGVYQL